MRIEKLSDMYETLKGKMQKKRLVVAFANDEHSIEAVHMAVEAGMVDGILVGDTEVIRRICEEKGYNFSGFKVVHETNDVKAAEKAVELVRKGEADFIMKGLVSTDRYMHAILNRKKGLLPPNTLLSHVTVMECASYHKLLVISDVAVVPVPDIEQKKIMIQYVARTANKLGIERPKVALITPTEQVLPKVPSTIDAAILAKMGERGQLGNIAVEGPIALDVAIDKETAAIKNLHSEVAGDADCLIFPNLETGNVFYKANTKLGSSQLGAVLIGAKAPCVLSSRGDSVQTKLNSIALAALLSE